MTSTGNNYGIAVATNQLVTIIHSTFARNSVAGIEGDGGSVLVVAGSAINFNGTGVQSGSAVRLSNRNVMYNQTAINGATGSFGNNQFTFNLAAGRALSPAGSSTTDVRQE